MYLTICGNLVIGLINKPKLFMINLRLTGSSIYYATLQWVPPNLCYTV